jgi:prepilin-type N-terminal cleavage/methylation domain-containing protein
MGTDVTNLQVVWSQRQSNARRGGFTLIELLVVLVLSGLILRLMLPMFAEARRMKPTDAPASATWRSILTADLQNLVGQSKSAVPIVCIRRPAKVGDFVRLEIQSLLRPEDGSRGPAMVRYVLERDIATSDLSLVRYSQGWHDGVSSRYVLVHHLMDWDLQIANASGNVKQSAHRSSTTQPLTEGELMQVNLRRTDQQITANFCVGSEVVIQ